MEAVPEAVAEGSVTAVLEVAAAEEEAALAVEAATRVVLTKVDSEVAEI